MPAINKKKGVAKANLQKVPKPVNAKAPKPKLISSRVSNSLLLFARAVG